MKLSDNFTLEELCVTKTGLPNIPNAEQIKSLTTLAQKVLQPARNFMGISIHVNSGFRSEKVNTKAGGAATSQHTKGEAADLSCQDNALLFRTIKEHLVYDQLIWEGGNHIQPQWVHVSYREGKNRGEVLRMEIINGKKQYTRI